MREFSEVAWSRFGPCIGKRLMKLLDGCFDLKIVFTQQPPPSPQPDTTATHSGNGDAARQRRCLRTTYMRREHVLLSTSTRTARLEREGKAQHATQHSSNLRSSIHQTKRSISVCSSICCPLPPPLPPPLAALAFLFCSFLVFFFLPQRAERTLSVPPYAGRRA